MKQKTRSVCLSQNNELLKFLFNEQKFCKRNEFVQIVSKTTTLAMFNTRIFDFFNSDDKMEKSASYDH